MHARQHGAGSAVRVRAGPRHPAIGRVMAMAALAVAW